MAKKLPDTAPIAERLAAERWFHAFDFGDVAVESAFHGDRRPNVHLYPVFEFLSEIDLTGLRCCDLGTYDGMTTFVMERMGAAEAVGLCQHDLKRFRLAKEALAADRVTYYPKRQAEEMLDIFGERSFDVIVVSATLHHFTNPQELLFICRRLLKRGGYFILEASVLPGDEPVQHLNTESSKPIWGNPTVWMPTLPCLRGMLKLAAFDAVAEMELTGVAGGYDHAPRRITHLVRAVRPTEVTGRTQKLADVHDKAKWTGRIHFRDLENDQSEPSAAVFRGRTGLRRMNGWLHPTTAPLQPAWNDPRPGRDARFHVATDPYLKSLRSWRAAQAPTPDETARRARRGQKLTPSRLDLVGRLHAVDRIIAMGLDKVLDAGARPRRHLSRVLAPHVSLTRLLAEEPPKLDERAAILLGRLGESVPVGAGPFEAVVVTAADRLGADMDRVVADISGLLTPGGWSIGSFDFTGVEGQAQAEAWLAAHLNAGFHGPEPVEAEPDAPDEAAITRDWLAKGACEAEEADTFRPVMEVEPLAWWERFFRKAQRRSTMLYALRKPI